MRIYDSLFITGPVVFFIIYLHTDSFITAISILAFIWVLAIATYLSYRFEFGDVGGYIHDVKKVKQSIRNRFINTLLAVCILSVCYAGIFSGAFIGSRFFGNNGFVYFVFGFIGAILFLKLFYISILKRLENI